MGAFQSRELPRASAKIQRARFLIDDRPQWRSASSPAPKDAHLRLIANAVIPQIPFPSDPDLANLFAKEFEETSCRLPSSGARSRRRG